MYCNLVQTPVKENTVQLVHNLFGHHGTDFSPDNDPDVTKSDASQRTQGLGPCHHVNKTQKILQSCRSLCPYFFDLAIYFSCHTFPTACLLTHSFSSPQ